MTPTTEQRKKDARTMSCTPRKSAMFAYTNLAQSDADPLCDALANIPCSTTADPWSRESNTYHVGVHFPQSDCRLYDKVESLAEFQRLYKGNLSEIDAYLCLSTVPSQFTEDTDGSKWVDGNLVHYFPPSSTTNGTRSQARVTRCAYKINPKADLNTYTIRNREGCTSKDRTPIERHSIYSLEKIAGPKGYQILKHAAPPDTQELSIYDPEAYARSFEDMLTSTT